MITNNTITYYHRNYNGDRLTEWHRFVFENVWEFGRTGSVVNTGYENNNAIDVRIPLEQVEDTSIFRLGDIIAIGKQRPIFKQSDLNNIEFYNVTNVNVNNFGNSPHIHLSGK